MSDAIGHAYLAQGEGFDETWVFDTPEARDAFITLKGRDWTPQSEVICDLAFVHQIALEELRDLGHEINIYLNERGVNFERIDGPTAVDLLEWWSDFEPDADQETWDRVNGPELDEKARELILAGAHFGPLPIEYEGSRYTPCESCDSLHPIDAGGGYTCPAED